MGFFIKKKRENKTIVHECACGCRRFRLISELHIKNVGVRIDSFTLHDTSLFECYECNKTYDKYGIFTGVI